jgi:D-alanine-D-alanine ligase
MSQHLQDKQTFVAVVYNNTEEDQYEKLREIDPATLGFTPIYNVHVATVLEEYRAIVQALEHEGYRVTLLNFEDDLSRLQHLLFEEHPDVIFNLVEMFQGDPRLESAIASLFDLCDIPYTGSGPGALDLCQNKAITKEVLLKHGIATPGYRLLKKPEISRLHRLRYPLIVKPAREDASVGVESGSVVYDHDQLLERTQLIFATFKPPVLVEEFIAGKELHVSILGNDPPQALPIIEFDFSSLPEEHPAIITYAVKWNPLDLAYHKVHAICPAQLSPAIEEAVKDQALRAYQAVNCRDYARIDVRLDESGVPYVLEVNPNPDLTESVSFMQSAEKSGLSFSQALARIVQYALLRVPKRRAAPPRQSSR